MPAIVTLRAVGFRRRSILTVAGMARSYGFRFARGWAAS